MSTIAFEQPGFRPTSFKAAADLSTKQFFAVSITGDNVVNLASADVADYGTLNNAPKSGEAAEVVRNGITKAVASGAIVSGAEVAVATGGKYKTATSGKFIVGRAATPAAADGDVFSLDRQPEGIKA